jgi:hypothetical protein
MTVSPGENLRNPQSEFTLNQHNLSAGDYFVSDDQVDWIGNLPIERNHSTRTDLQQLRQRHLPRAKSYVGFELDIEQAWNWV